MSRFFGNHLVGMRVLGIILATHWGLLATAIAQQSQFPQNTPMPVNQLPSTTPNQAASFVPQTKLVPITRSPSSPSVPRASLGSPLFDPYQTPLNGTASSQSNFSTPSPSIFGGLSPGIDGGRYPAAGPPSFGAVGFGQQPNLPPAEIIAPPPTWSETIPPVTNSMPPSAYPIDAYPNSAPSTLFPNGIWGGPNSLWRGNGVGLPGPFRLVQGVRLRHTWLYGGSDSDDLDINDTDVSVVFAIPTFLYSSQPLYIAPSFSLHLWDGPQGAAGGAADLPSSAYSAFIDAGWQSDPMRIMGAELGLRVGVFTDFDTMNSDSLRIQGRALGVFRISPTSTLKFGVIYTDRNRVKILPAGGIFWRPNPETRVDLYFPTPKYSRYIRTVGVHDTWGYIAAEYGGGSWTVQRAGGGNESIDINDVRVSIGLEWGRNDLIWKGNRTGFFDIGYVFDREVLYKKNPAHNFTPDGTFFLRLGFGY